VSDLVRLSFSIESSLYEKMETLVKQRGYENRSEFIRDLVRKELVQDDWKDDKDAVGTLTLVLDHHQRELGQKMNNFQHQHFHEILVSSHVHLDHDYCLEAIILKGRSNKLKEIANTLGQQKGVLHSSLSMSSHGQSLA
jgi:CopG family transcriptional regulator, nickel-responsive regulator